METLPTIATFSDPCPMGVSHGRGALCWLLASLLSTLQHYYQHLLPNNEQTQLSGCTCCLRACILDGRQGGFDIKIKKHTEILTWDNSSMCESCFLTPFELLARSLLQSKYYAIIFCTSGFNSNLDYPICRNAYLHCIYRSRQQHSICQHHRLLTIQLYDNITLGLDTGDGARSMDLNYPC